MTVTTSVSTHSGRPRQRVTVLGSTGSIGVNTLDVVARHPDRLVGYFTGDIGAVNQLIHVWKFDDDADRRAFGQGCSTTPSSWPLPSKHAPCCCRKKTS